MQRASAASVEYRGPSHKDLNLRQRIVIALFTLPFIGWVIADGRWLFGLTFASMLSLAAAEYGHLFRSHGFRPAVPLLTIGVFGLAAGRHWFGFEHMPLFLAGICLLSQVWHMVDYERGAPRSGTDFAITVTGIVFIGWVGSYLISLRHLPDGGWWTLVILPSVWLADGIAFVMGKAFGRHPLSNRISPNKSWEGYLSGIVASALGGLGMTLLWRISAGPESTLTGDRGLVVGIVIGVLAPLGDLGVSMIKREIRVKDTSTLLPGHGGLLDRLDSWLWAGVLGYYMVTWLTP